MVLVALSAPKMPILFLGLTRDSAKAAVWDTLIGMLEGLGVSHEARPSALAVTLFNGSTITLFGADTPGARARLRGRKFKLICCDEAGFVSGSNMDPLIVALLPSLADYYGTLVMASSPGETFDGLFYHAYQGEQKQYWSQHWWDILSNPEFMKPAVDSARFKTRGEEELTTICERQFGGDWEHPQFLREYRGRYVRDTSRLVYPYHEKNLIDANYPLEREMYAMGVDLGVSTDSAIVVAKFSEYSREFQVVDTWAESHCSVDELAAEIQSRCDRYGVMMIVADTGGLGAATVQELRRRYQLPIKAAEKKEKAFFQRIVANDLAVGYIKIPRGCDLLREWDTLVKDETGEETKGIPNHKADAFLYCYRYAYNTYLKSAEPRQTAEQLMVASLLRAVREEEEAKRDEY